MSDLTNAQKQENYALHARETYASLNEGRAEARRGHMDFGKWVIASLLVIHGGSIYTISNLHDKSAIASVEALRSAAAYNIAGITLTIIAGFFAWINLMLAEKKFRDWTNPAMLYDRDKWPQKSAWHSLVRGCLYGAAISAVTSLGCFVAGATMIWAALR